MGVPKSHIVRERAALRVLASPFRREIVDTLGRLGETNVSALAQALSRPADGLYYHLRLLKSAGLIRMWEGPRWEGPGVRVAPVGRRVTASEKKLVHEHGPELSAIVSKMVRLGVRDYRRALARGNAAFEGKRRELVALRATGWLSRRDIEPLNLLIREVSGFVAGARRIRGEERLYALTILLTPVERRRRKRG